MMETSSFSGLVDKAKSMPNLMEDSSVLDGIQEHERRAYMYSTKRRPFLKDSYSTSPREVNNEFYTQNFNQSQKGKETVCIAPHTAIKSLSWSPFKLISIFVLILSSIIQNRKSTWFHCFFISYTTFNPFLPFYNSGRLYTRQKKNQENEIPWGAYDDLQRLSKFSSASWC